MSETMAPTAALLGRLRAGDPAARNDLIAHTQDRLRALARRMLRGFPQVARREETGDVLQGALLRLWRALDAVTLDTPLHFYRLAARHIRWELLDLAAKHGGPEGTGANHQTDWSGMLLTGAADPTGEPYSLAEWADFHRAVEGLPDEERETFGLLWYGGLTQEEAAEVLGVSVRTVKRRWVAARLALQRTLDGGPT